MKNSKKPGENYPQNDIMVKPTSNGLQLRSDLARRLWGSQVSNNDTLISRPEFPIQKNLLVAKVNVFLETEQYLALSTLLDDPILADHSDFPFISIFASTMSMLESPQQLNLGLFLNQIAQLIDLHERNSEPKYIELLEKLISKAHQLGIIDQLVSLTQDPFIPYTTFPIDGLDEKKIEQIDDFLEFLALWDCNSQH